MFGEELKGRGGVCPDLTFSKIFNEDVFITQGKAMEHHGPSVPAKYYLLRG